MSRFKGLIALLVLPGAGSLFALEADREKPIHIQADSAMVNEKEGNSIYRGDVIIEQGTLHISAEQVEIITDGDRVIQIIATGGESRESRAHFEQQPGVDEDTVFADARMITYFVQEERLHLTGNASLRQTDDRFSGDLLYYNVNEGILSLNSSGQQGDRVNMTIIPDNQ